MIGQSKLKLRVENFLLAMINFSELEARAEILSYANV